MHMTGALAGVSRGCCRRVFSLGCFLIVLCGFRSCLADEGRGESAAVQTVESCTVDTDATVVFAPEDTEKLFECPKGWKFEPTGTDSAFQRDGETRNLVDIFPRASLRESESVYTLSLPTDGDRERTTWYYTCTAQADSSGEAVGGGSPSVGGETDTGVSAPPAISSPAPGVNPEVPDSSRPEQPRPPVAPLPVAPSGGSSGANPGSGRGSGSRPGSQDTRPDAILPQEDDRLNLRPQPDHEEGRGGEDALQSDVNLGEQGLKGEPEHSVNQAGGGGGQESAQSGGPKEELAFAIRGRARTPPPREARQDKRNTCRITIDVLPSNLIECAAAGATKTAAVSAAGERVAFKCGEGLALKPEELDRVFDDKDGLCASQVALTTLVRGSLSRLPPVSDLQAKPAAYVLRVDELPAEQQALCYKCVGTSTGAKTDEEPKEPLKECLVKIAVSSAASSQSCVADLLSFHPLLVLLALSSVH